MTNTQKKSKTNWHHRFGRLLQLLLESVGIDVKMDYPLTRDPPEADVLLLRRTDARWTVEQYNRLPDGIRHTLAGHVLLEFKHGESINEKAIQQALVYDYHYRRSNPNLKNADVQVFLISARTPRAAVLAELGYEPTAHAGVYRNRYPVSRLITLIVLNELSPEPHNAFVKCLGTRKKERERALATIKGLDIKGLSIRLYQFLAGLNWLTEQGEDMQIQLTNEEVLEMGQVFGDIFLKITPPEDVLSNFTPEEVLSNFTPQERLAGLDPNVIAAYLKGMQQGPAINRD